MWENMINLIMNNYKNSIANVLLLSGKIEAFLSCMGTKQGCTRSLPLFNMLSNFLPTEMRQKRKKRQERWKVGERKRGRKNDGREEGKKWKEERKEGKKERREGGRQAGKEKRYERKK
jgi:hypothetical protein